MNNFNLWLVSLYASMHTPAATYSADILVSTYSPDILVYLPTPLIYKYLPTPQIY